jgi:Holliday junction resolvase RusA-like endonuclease
MKDNYEDKNRATIPIADLESSPGDEPVAKKGFEGFDSLVNIKVTSYRKLKHDPDGISAKAALDGIVRRGILADDSTEQIKSITFESIKSKEEKTVIEIETV